MPPQRASPPPGADPAAAAEGDRGLRLAGPRRGGPPGRAEALGIRARGRRRGHLRRPRGPRVPRRERDAGGARRGALKD